MYSKSVNSTHEFPSISIVTVNLNADVSVFKQVLESIKKQNYHSKIEHIVVDGGSTNGSIKLAKEYGCTVIVREDLAHNAEERQFIGIKKAKNDIVAIIETDNILPDKNWMNRMIEPFRKDKKVFCTFNSYNCCDSEMPVLTRYNALFGVSDPVLYYLGKSEKLTWFEKKYTKGKPLYRDEKFSIVSFDLKTLPTLGDNGCLFKKEAFNRLTVSQKDFIHLDIFVDFLQLGYDRFGVVNNCISHMTGASIIKLIKRRLTYRQTFYEEMKGKRKYLVFDPHSRIDTMNILKFCFYTITGFQPLFLSIKGFINKRDTAWFLHIVICWIFLISYVSFTIHTKFQRSKVL